MTENIGSWTKSQLTKFIRSLPADAFARPRPSSTVELERVRAEVAAATTLSELQAATLKLIDLTLNP